MIHAIVFMLQFPTLLKAVQGANFKHEYLLFIISSTGKPVVPALKAINFSSIELYTWTFCHQFTSTCHENIASIHSVNKRHHLQFSSNPIIICTIFHFLRVEIKLDGISVVAGIIFNSQNVMSSLGFVVLECSSCESQ